MPGREDTGRCLLPGCLRDEPCPLGPRSFGPAARETDELVVLCPRRSALQGNKSCLLPRSGGATDGYRRGSTCTRQYARRMSARSLSYSARLQRRPSRLYAVLSWLLPPLENILV